MRTAPRLPHPATPAPPTPPFPSRSVRVPLARRTRLMPMSWGLLPGVEEYQSQLKALSQAFDVLGEEDEQAGSSLEGLRDLLLTFGAEEAAAALLPPSADEAAQAQEQQQQQQPVQALGGGGGVQLGADSRGVGSHGERFRIRYLTIGPVEGFG